MNPYIKFINLIIFSLFIFSTSISASAKTSNAQKRSDFNKKLISQVNKNDPTKAKTKSFNKLSKNKFNLNSDQNSLKLDVDIDQNKIGIINNSFKMSLESPIKENPEFIDGKLIYSNEKNQIMIEAVEGGVRQVINILSDKSPKTYNFPMKLNEGELIKLNSDGSAKIVDKLGELKIAILKPWAVDNNKKELKTWYTIDKNNLIQNIDFTGAVFPILADPTWCGNRFNSVKWINRDGMWSASIDPTWCGAWYSGTWETWNAWTDVYQMIPYHPAWPYPQAFATDTYWSMFNQFACPGDYAIGLKTPWNIEPARKDKGYWGFVRNSCN